MPDSLVAQGQKCPLTPTQLQTLLMVMRGQTYKQVALERGIAVSTVRTHLHSIYVRLRVSSATQAGALMLRQGWTRPDDVLTGLSYSTVPQRDMRGKTWLPSPAQRLYLDAFDRLLRDRTDEAADGVNLCFQVLCHERRVPARRPFREDIEDVLLSMARGLLRVI